MRRFHLVEIEDLVWVPRSIRDAVTENIRFALDFTNKYSPIVPHLRRALKCAKTRQIVDLCSGGGGPWLRLCRELNGANDSGVKICLTDKYPNRRAFVHAQCVSKDRIRFNESPVDAASLPPELKGFRTFFSSFHHFRPDLARAILQDAVANKQGIGVFEVTARRPTALLALCFAPAWVLAVAPFMRPFRWSRLFWTYVIPVAPFLMMFDGLISCLRTYSVTELCELTKNLGENGYIWEAGQEWSRYLPMPVTYLIGYPASGKEPAPERPRKAREVSGRGSERRKAKGQRRRGI